MFLSVAFSLTAHSTGKERDETGLDYFGARYYSGAHGRFTSPDPLLNSGRPWIPQSWNRYAYTFNNPLRYTDPTGLFEWDETLGGKRSLEELDEWAGDDQERKLAARGIRELRQRIIRELNRMKNSRNPRLQNAAKAIGEPGEINGVKISMGDVRAGLDAEISYFSPLKIDANGNPILDIRVRPGARGDLLFQDLSHEGTHASQAQSFVKGSSPSILGIDAEIEAYEATTAAARERGASRFGPTGSGFIFWDSSWSRVDKQTRPKQEIEKYLRFSGQYSDDDLYSPAFTK
jgi:RHS repeat-associated protein